MSPIVQADKPLPLNPGAVPDELRDAPIWVGWRLVWQQPKNGKPGRWTKEPINLKNGAYAKSDNPSTWTSYNHALSNYRRWSCDGIGHVRTDNQILIDLDGVLDENGNLKPYPWAQKILMAIKGRAYIEQSVMGKGLHAVCLGSLPDLGKCQYNEPGQEHCGFALYTGPRYFTYSGVVWPGSGPISDLTDVLTPLCHEYFPPKATSLNGNGHHTVTLNISDSELLEKMFSAQNGAAIERLWRGEWEGRYASQSEADLALLAHLAFWTGRDAARMDALFRQSGLMREKWERPDYRERTINEAVAGCHDVYEPRGNGTAGPEASNHTKSADGSADESGKLRQERAETGQKATRAQAGSLVTRCLADIEPKPVSWLWPGRIPRGKSTLVAGDPGLGKSQITASIAAVVTTGGQWPVTREQCEPGDVLFLTAEDDAADTLWPRLEAAGADRSRIHVVEAVVVGYTGDGSQQQRTFSLEKDLRALETRLTELGSVAAVVIDPITAYLGSIDSHRNAEVRGLLAPLSALIARHNVALIAVSHLSKAVGPKALMRVNGSGAFGAIPRGAYLVTPDPADKNRRLFLPMKNNLGKEINGLAFRIEGVTVASPAGPLETSRVMWEQGPVTMTADEAMQADTPEGVGNAVAETADWLREILVDGPIPSLEIFKRGDAEGFSKRTLKRAASKLGIKPAKSGMSGGWSWSLPPKGAKTTEECQQKNLAPFAEFGTLRSPQDAEVEL